MCVLYLSIYLYPPVHPFQYLKVQDASAEAADAGIGDAPRGNELSHRYTVYTSRTAGKTEREKCRNKARRLILLMLKVYL